jgi:coenzyme F420-reducing hydrogenase alpha subunit
MATKLKAQMEIIASPNLTLNPKVQPKCRSNAQRQADYRARHLKDENSQLERLSLLVDLHAKRALERLACCYGVTQRAMLERLVMQADRVTQQQAQEQSTDGQAGYFDKRISLQWPVVTR